MENKVQGGRARATGLPVPEIPITEFTWFPEERTLHAGITDLLGYLGKPAGDTPFARLYLQAEFTGFAVQGKRERHLYRVTRRVETEEEFVGWELRADDTDVTVFVVND